MNLNGKYRLWVMTTCQGRFTFGEKEAFWRVMLFRAAIHVGEQQTDEKSLYFPPNSYFKPRTTLKKMFKKIKAKEKYLFKTLEESYLHR